MRGYGECSENYLYSGDIVKEGYAVKFTDLYPKLTDTFVNRFTGTLDSVVYDTNEIIIHGLKYWPGVCLLVGWENTDPVFARIEKLFVYEYTKFAICSSLEILRFEWTSNSFHVEPTDNIDIIVLKDMKNTWPLPQYEIDGEKYICSRYSHFGQVFF